MGSLWSEERLEETIEEVCATALSHLQYSKRQVKVQEDSTSVHNTSSQLLLSLLS